MNETAKGAAHVAWAQHPAVAGRAPAKSINQSEQIVTRTILLALLLITQSGCLSLNLLDWSHPGRLSAISARYVAQPPRVQVSVHYTRLSWGGLGSRQLTVHTLLLLAPGWETANPTVRRRVTREVPWQASMQHASNIPPGLNQPVSNRLRFYRKGGRLYIRQPRKAGRLLASWPESIYRWRPWVSAPAYLITAPLDLITLPLQLLLGTWG